MQLVVTSYLHQYVSSQSKWCSFLWLRLIFNLVAYFLHYSHFSASLRQNRGSFSIQRTLSLYCKKIYYTANVHVSSYQLYTAISLKTETLFFSLFNLSPRKRLMDSWCWTLLFKKLLRNYTFQFWISTPFYSQMSHKLPWAASFLALLLVFHYGPYLGSIYFQPCPLSHLLSWRHDFPSEALLDDLLWYRRCLLEWPRAMVRRSRPSILSLLIDLFTWEFSH